LRYKAIISYDGTNYSGYQKQVNQLAIQSVIEKALRLMTRMDIDTFASSRTDKGVHALYQVLHFDSDIDLESSQWIDALHKRMPSDIRILSVTKVKDSFHARHSAKSKRYIYKIAKYPSTAFSGHHELYVKHFDINNVKDILETIVGTHDFSGFSPNKENKPPIKTIYSFDYKETKTHYIFNIHGNSFLRYMVRIIMGNVIAVATNQKTQSQLQILLDTKDRSLSAKTADSKGLYLKHIYY